MSEGWKRMSSTRTKEVVEPGPSSFQTRIFLSPSSSHLHISWLVVKCPSSYLGNTLLSLSLSLALFFSVRRHPSLFKGKFRSGWFSQAVLDKAQGGACSIRGTVAESGTRLVACLYSLQLYKKDVKTEGNRGRDYNLTRDRQEEDLSLSLSRSSTDNKTSSLPLFPFLSTTCSILRDVN